MAEKAPFSSRERCESWCDSSLLDGPFTEVVTEITWVHRALQIQSFIKCCFISICLVTFTVNAPAFWIPLLGEKRCKVWRGWGTISQSPGAYRESQKSVMGGPWKSPNTGLPTCLHVRISGEVCGIASHSGLTPEALI